MSVLDLIGLKTAGAYCFYTVGGVSAVLVGVKCKKGQQPVIPERIGKLTVRGIDDPFCPGRIGNAFSSLEEKKQERIKKKLDSFSRLTVLKPEQLPKTVEYIGYSAADALSPFQSATNNSTLQFPSHIHYIRELRPGYNAKFLILPESLRYLGKLSSKQLISLKYSGDACSTVPCHSLSDYLGYEIEDVSQIGDGTFAQCPALSTLALSDRIEKIGRDAMPPVTPSEYPPCINSHQQYSLHIPQQLQDVEPDAFRAAVVNGLTYPDDLCEALRCRKFSLQKITQLNIRDIGKLEQYTHLLQQGNDPETFPDKCLYYLIRQAEHIRLPQTQKQIFDGMFADCKLLSTVSIETAHTNTEESIGIRQIGNDAFSGCSRLNPTPILTSVRQIGDRAFRGCDAMILKLPEGLEYIGSQAFANCGKLKTFNIPATVKYLAADAFQGCSNLRSNSTIVKELEAFPEVQEQVILSWAKNVQAFIELGDKQLSDNVTTENKHSAYTYYRKALEYDPFSTTAMYRLERLLLDTAVPHCITVNELENLRTFLLAQGSKEVAEYLYSTLATLDDMCVILSDADDISTQWLIYSLNCDQEAAARLLEVLLDTYEKHPAIDEHNRYEVRRIANLLLCTHTHNQTSESQKRFDRAKQRTVERLGTGYFMEEKYCITSILTSKKLLGRCKTELAKQNATGFSNAEFWLELARAFDPSVQVPDGFAQQTAMYRGGPKINLFPQKPESIVLPPTPTFPYFPFIADPPASNSSANTEQSELDELVSEYWANVAAQKAAEELENLWGDLGSSGFWDDKSWQ